MSDELTPQAAALVAAQAAVAKAEQDSQTLEIVRLLLAQQAAQSHGGHGCGCQSHGPAPAPQKGSAARPVAIAAGVVVGGCVLTGLFLAVALTAVAVGVSAVVLLLLVRELRKGTK